MSFLPFIHTCCPPPPQYGLYRANGDLLFMGMCDSCETTVPMQKGCAAMGNGQREEIRII